MTSTCWPLHDFNLLGAAPAVPGRGLCACRAGSRLLRLPRQVNAVAPAASGRGCCTPPAEPANDWVVCASPAAAPLSPPGFPPRRPSMPGHGADAGSGRAALGAALHAFSTVPEAPAARRSQRQQRSRMGCTAGTSRWGASTPSPRWLRHETREGGCLSQRAQGGAAAAFALRAWSQI